MALSKNSRILLVDDSPAIQALLKDLLNAHGFSNVVTAGSVEEGVEKFEEEEPELVFLDLMMPESSGIEFAKTVLTKNPKARIVLTTALPPSHDAVLMGISQGAVEYLQKPLRNDNVSLVLDRLQREERAREASNYYFS